MRPHFSTGPDSAALTAIFTGQIMSSSTAICFITIVFIKQPKNQSFCLTHASSQF
uniref:Uncharacterized protein n=1 Tax=Anguilla anguilla TaxID=7936 RepID=A0A0E9S660_ANGAN